jgi:hypothetical protein
MDRNPPHAKPNRTIILAADCPDWTPRLTAAAGLGVSPVTAASNDAQLNKTLVHFRTNQVPQLALKIRSTAASTGAQLYFGTLAEPGASATRVVSSSYSPANTWELVTLHPAASLRIALGEWTAASPAP